MKRYKLACVTRRRDKDLFPVAMAVFKKQMYPETWKFLMISLFGVISSALMQFLLAYYLWCRLPPIWPQTLGSGAKLPGFPPQDGSYGISTVENDTYVSWHSQYECQNCFCPQAVPLPAYQYPNYQNANDVCRTEATVQLVCIGLFLFYVLNNVPSVFKNILIILDSDRFDSHPPF